MTIGQILGEGDFTSICQICSERNNQNEARNKLTKSSQTYNAIFTIAIIRILESQKTKHVTVK